MITCLRHTKYLEEGLLTSRHVPLHVEVLRPVSAQHLLPHPEALASFWTPHIGSSREGMRLERTQGEPSGAPVARIFLPSRCGEGPSLTDQECSRETVAWACSPTPSSARSAPSPRVLTFLFLPPPCAPDVLLLKVSRSLGRWQLSH